LSDRTGNRGSIVSGGRTSGNVSLHKTSASVNDKTDVMSTQSVLGGSDALKALENSATGVEPEQRLGVDVILTAIFDGLEKISGYPGVFSVVEDVGLVTN